MEGTYIIGNAEERGKEDRTRTQNEWRTNWDGGGFLPCELLSRAVVLHGGAGLGVKITLIAAAVEPGDGAD